MPSLDKSKTNSPAPLRALLAIWSIPGDTWRGMMRAGSLKAWMQFGAAVMLTIVAMLLVQIFCNKLQPGEPFWIIETVLFIVLIAVVALMEFRLNLSASKTGLQADMSGEHDLDVTTTTTTKVSPPAGGA